MTSLCILCIPREGEEGHAPEPGWRCCWRAHDRMAAALRDVPVLVDELSGLGYVERDTRRERCSTPECFLRGEPVDVIATVRQEPPKQPRYGVRLCVECAVRLKHAGRIVDHVAIPARPADPAAHRLTAGPVNGARSGPRVMSSGERSLPIRIDPTDLLAPARPASLAVADTGLYASDQIGHLAVATELEFWARDWADARGERCPYPTVPVLAGWLLDRLDWACAHHPAIEEFAGKLTHLRTVLTAATGRLPARPEPVDRPCPACGVLALQRPPDGRFIECGSCGRALTDDEYRDHLEDVIKTNWTVVTDNERSWPPVNDLVWLRDDERTGVVAGCRLAGVWVDWYGSQLRAVSYWAPLVAPADPGPAKEDVPTSGR